jgi:F-type H+-transporting ATPase subunit gamma
VLESLVRHTGDSGDVMHPLLVEREEKNVLVIVVAGDKGFAGAFNSNIVKAAQSFIDARRAAGQNVDIEPVGRKARDTVRKRYPAAVYEKKEEHSTTISPLTSKSSAIGLSRSRSLPIIRRSF